MKDINILIAMETASQLEAYIADWERKSPTNNMYAKTDGVGGIERLQFIMSVLREFEVAGFDHAPYTARVYDLGEYLAGAIFDSLVVCSDLPNVDICHKSLHLTIARIENDWAHTAGAASCEN